MADSKFFNQTFECNKVPTTLKQYDEAQTALRTGTWPLKRISNAQIIRLHLVSMENEKSNDGIGYGINEVAVVVQSIFPEHKLLENTPQKRRRFFVRLQKLTDCARGRGQHSKIQHSFLAQEWKLPKPRGVNAPTTINKQGRKKRLRFAGASSLSTQKDRKRNRKSATLHKWRINFDRHCQQQSEICGDLSSDSDIDLEDESLCPICLEHIQPSCKCITQCGHTHCQPCLQYWCSISPLQQCPICRQQITAISKGNTPVFIPEAPPHKIKTDSSVSKDDAKLSVHSMVASACQIQLDPKTAVQQFDSPQKSRLTQLITEIHKVSPVTVKHHPVVKRQVCQQKREHSQLLQKQFDEKQSRSQHAALKTVSQSKGQLTRTKRKLNLTTAELKRQCTVNIKLRGENKCLKATIVNTQVKAREEQERTGSIVHDLRKDKRDLRQDNDSLKRQIADARKDNAYHLEMSNRLQQQLDAVIAEQGAEMLTPYKRKVLKLQKAITKLQQSEATWMATRQSRKLEASGQLQLLRRRKKLNQTVTKLANATKQLRAQLKQKEDKSRLQKIRSENKVLKQNNCKFEHENDVLKETIEEITDQLPGYLPDMPLADSVQQWRYPDAFVQDAVVLMGQAGVPASQVVEAVKVGWRHSVKDVEKFRWPSQSTVGRWGSSILHLVRIQIGWILTTAVRQGDTNWCLSQDGTPENQKHVEAFVIELKEGRIGGIPWVQGNKTGKESAWGCCEELKKCHEAYQDLYDHSVHQGLSDEMPKPVDKRDFICSIKCTVSDHAANEGKRVQEFSALRDSFIDELAEEGDTRFTKGLHDGGCVMHKQMLIAKQEQKSNQKVLEELLTSDRDRHIREFVQSNCLDGLQLQLGKLFGHGVDSYVFGDGVNAFPAFMKGKHPEVKGYNMKRMVGNRALVFQENALVHYFMVPYYLEWCNYVRKKKNSANMLHVRVEAQLRCKEELAGLRARAISMDKIHQPWRVFINGVIPETGKPRPYLEMGPAIRKLYDVSKQLIQDPAFMVDPDWRFLAHDEQVSKHHEKWRNHLKQESKLFKLYDGAVEDRFLLLYLKSQGVAIKLQLERNSADFLDVGGVKGKYFNPSAALKASMATATSTSVGVERQFAIKDNITRISSSNLSFHTCTAKSAYQSNNTHEWMLSHSSRTRLLITRRCRANERSTWRASAKMAGRAAALKAVAEKNKEVAAEKTIINQMKKCLALEHKKLFVTVAEFNSFIEEQVDHKRAVDKEIRAQVQLLITYYGLKRADIMIFKGLSFGVIVETFRHVVERIESGGYGPMKRCSIVDKLKSDPHIFRGGTATDEALESDAADQLWMNGLLARARKEFGEQMQAKLMKKNKRKVKKKEKDPLIGRTVAMKQSLWGGGASNEYYFGIVIKRCSIKYRGSMRDGYDIKWDDKKIENWSVEDVAAALVETDNEVDGDVDLGRGSVFDDNDYVLIGKIEIQEPDGEWRVVTMFRDKKYMNIVLHFGGDDYEGINVTGGDIGVGSGYRMKDGEMYDDEGDKINSRPVSTPGTSNSTEPTPVPQKVPITDNLLDHEYDEVCMTMSDVHSMDVDVVDDDSVIIDT